MIAWATSAAVPKAEPAPRREASDCTPLPISTALAAVGHIPNDGPKNYDWWLRIIFAIHAATGGSREGHGLAHAISAKNASYDPAETNKAWRSAKSDRPDGITARTLLYEARKHPGWVDPADIDAFDVIPDDVDDEPKAVRSVIMGPEASRVRDDLFDSPPKAPPMIIDGFLPCDAGMLVGPGSLGKTTFKLVEAVHLILGKPFLGCRVNRAGGVLIITAEDSRSRLEYRLHQVMGAMDLDLLERQRVLKNIYFEDTRQGTPRLIAADKGGNLVRTKVGEAIVKVYEGEGLAQVVIDPAVYFGPGERFVNDGEAELMRTCRLIGMDLNAAVCAVHHVGKASAREKTHDQYAGRGGSAGADNARFIHAMVVHEAGTIMAPPSIDPAAIAAKRVLRLHVAKISDAPPQVDPFWLVRNGWAFEHHADCPFDERTRETREIEELAAFLRRRFGEGVKYSKTALKTAYKELGAGWRRDQVASRIDAGLQRGLLLEVDLPPDECQGGRKTYLREGLA